MGLVSSRLNLDNFYSGRRRSQQDETLFNYSMNKNYFSNYFLMGGELFEVNNPDYLFGDNCDLNFLSCTKPYSLPYKQAQQNLLANLSSKQKAINKCSNRVNRLGSPFNLLDCRHRRRDLNNRKQDAQTQTLHNSTKGDPNGSEPSRTIVMLVNIRKETLRLVKSSTVSNLDSELNSLTNSVSIIPPLTSQPPNVAEASTADNSPDSEPTTNLLGRRRSSPEQSQKQASSGLELKANSIEHSVAVDDQAMASTAIQFAESATLDDNASHSGCGKSDGPPANTKRVDPEMSSLISATSSIRSGYTSVGEDVQLAPGVDDNSSSSDDDEEYKDALNDATNISLGKSEDNDNDSEKTQQEKSLLGSDNRQTSSTKENRDIKITIGPQDNSFDEDYSTSASNSCDIETTATITKNPKLNDGDENGFSTSHSTPKRTRRRNLSFSSASLSSKRLTKSALKNATEPKIATKTSSNNTNRIYNIEFSFDAEVDCTIRIFYFCTREITSAGVTYKPQHATYKSKIYYYKKGLNQKFDQQEHNFQPYLFDEDLLIYKPLDLDGNYNSGAVFPIVIQCIASEGPKPRQSHSLVATIEKSQLDDSYSIKALKQLIFVDGVQYILQDIYGIEHKQIGVTNAPGKANDRLATAGSGLRAKSRSFQSDLNTGSQLNLNDTASMTSVDLSLTSRDQNRGSLISQRKSLTGENVSECVICMSEERDTMLLPCRHLCLCSTCAQSLRYQANSCPICRCPFKASLNLRPIHRNSQSTFSIA